MNSLNETITTNAHQWLKRDDVRTIFLAAIRLNKKSGRRFCCCCCVLIVCKAVWTAIMTICNNNFWSLSAGKPKMHKVMILCERDTSTVQFFMQSIRHQSNQQQLSFPSGRECHRYEVHDYYLLRLSRVVFLLCQQLLLLCQASLARLAWHIRYFCVLVHWCRRHTAFHLICVRCRK